MTTTEPPFIALVLPAKLWDAAQIWLRLSGVGIVPTPTGPGQMPRFGVKPSTVDNIDRAKARRWELTDREIQVLDGMSQGKSNRDIGGALFLSEDTVKTHARRMFQKLRVHDRAGAVAVAFREGILT